MPIGSIIASLLRTKGKTVAKSEQSFSFEPPISKEGEKVFADAAFMRAQVKLHHKIKKDDSFALGKSFASLSKLAGDSRYHRVSRLVLHEVFSAGVPKEWAAQVEKSHGRVITALARVGRLDDVRKRVEIENPKAWDGWLNAYVRAISYVAWAPRANDAPEFAIDAQVLESERQLAFIIDKAAISLTAQLVVQFQEEADKIGNKKEQVMRSGRLRQKLYGDARKAILFGAFQWKVIQQVKDSKTRLDSIAKLQNLLSNEHIVSVAKLEMFYPSSLDEAPRGWNPKDSVALIQAWHQSVRKLVQGDDELYRVQVIERLIAEKLERTKRLLDTERVKAIGLKAA